MFLIGFIKQSFVRFKHRNKAKISRSATVSNVIFEGHNTIMKNVLTINSFLGEGTFININSKIVGCKIGRYCSIGDNVCTVLDSHPISTYTSSYPAFYYDTTSQLGFTFHKDKSIFECKKKPHGESKYNIIIGNDVWIGSHVLILGGVTIGDGAVIAAGAVVVKDVEPYSIVGGVPAKHIKHRFSRNIIENLQSSKWWTAPFNEIKNNYIHIRDMINLQ